MDEKKAIEYLSKDVTLNIDMIEGIKTGYAKVLQASDRGVLVYFENGGAYMMSTEDKKAADEMIERAAGAEMFVAHQDFYIEKIQSRFSLKERVVCNNVVYLSKKPLPEPDAGVTIRRLDERHLGFLMEHYSRANDEGYIRERLAAGAVFGAFCGNDLAGFIGMHSEGSMGMLEVLPQFRRKGIATALESFLVNRLLSQGRVPYGQVVIGNTASLNLQKKLGFTVSEKTVSWIV